MTVPFINYPATGNRLPGIFIDVDATRANNATAPLRAILFGQKTSSGTGAAGVAVLSQGVAHAKTIAGPGSILALMLARYRQTDPFGEVWLVPLADDGSAVAATGTIAFTGPATAAGTLSLYIGGQRVRQAVTSGMTASQLATALVATVNGQTDLPVTAAASSGTVTFTAKNAGALGNDIVISLNLLGLAGGEATPAGIGATITAMASGATNPSLTTALTNLGEQDFEFYGVPYTDSASLNAMQSFFSDATGRWSWQKMLYGCGFSAYRATVGNLATFGAGRNDNHMCVMGIPTDTPDPVWDWTADIVAAVANRVRTDPGQSFWTTALSVRPPSVATRFIATDRNTLLYDGISTFTVDAAGQVRIEKLITLYQVNAFNQPDDAWLSANRQFQLARVFRLIRQFQFNSFAGKKAVSDDTPVPPGSSFINAATVRAAVIGYYRSLQAAGLVQNADYFAQACRIEYSRGVFSEYLPIDVPNQAEQFPILAAFTSS